MKKSNKLAALIAGVFIALPATMYICNIAGGKKEAVKVASAIGGDNSPNAITTLVMTGKKAGLGMSYASDSKGSGHIVELNIMPESLNVHGDTMMISLSDESDVYQGRVLLNGLKSVIRNGRRYLVDNGLHDWPVEVADTAILTADTKRMKIKISPGQAVVSPAGGVIDDLNYGCEIDGKIYSEAFRPGMNCDSLAERMSEFAGEKIRPSDLRLTLTLLDKKGYKVSMEGLSDLAVAPRTGLRVVKGEVLGKVADSLLEIAVTRDGRTISAIDYLNNTLSAATMTNPDTPISAAKVLTSGQMRDDIAALVEAYKECFPLWEEHVSSETIDKKVEEITASMPDTLSAYDTEAIMARMNALLHDSHIFYESVMAESEVWRPDIEFGLEGAKVIVTMASREKSEYLQAEVKEIDGLVADSIVRFARKYIGGYDLKVKDYVDNMLFGALTHIYCTYHPAKKSNKSFIITLASGKQVEGSARTGIHDKTIMMPDRTAFLSVNRHPGRKYAVEGVCDSIVYIGLSDFDLYETDVDSLVGVMTEPERYSAVIVDLRNNPGGSSEVADRMLEALCGDVFPWPDQCRIMSKQGGFEAFANSLNYAPDSPVAGPEYTLDSVSQLYINSRVGRMAIGANSGATRPRIILITNEGTGSAASYFASALRRAGRAEIIGREPRTAYHLITAVKECCLRLPNSGVVWHLPLVREVFDSDTAGVVPYSRGILPDVHIPLTYREVSFVDGDIMKGKAIGMASDSKGGGRSSMVGLVAVVAIVCGWLWRRRHKGAVR